MKNRAVEYEGEDLPVHLICFGQIFSNPLANSFDDKKKKSCEKRPAKDLQDSQYYKTFAK